MFIEKCSRSDVRRAIPIRVSEEPRNRTWTIESRQSELFKLWVGIGPFLARNDLPAQPQMIVLDSGSPMSLDMLRFPFASSNPGLDSGLNMGLRSRIRARRLDRYLLKCLPPVQSSVHVDLL